MSIIIVRCEKCQKNFVSYDNSNTCQECKTGISGYQEVLHKFYDEVYYVRKIDIKDMRVVLLEKRKHTFFHVAARKHLINIGIDKDTID